MQGFCATRLREGFSTWRRRSVPHQDSRLFNTVTTPRAKLRCSSSSPVHALQRSESHGTRTFGTGMKTGSYGTISVRTGLWPGWPFM
jgi:hypothetical protein